jgi:hypothetical protein
LRILRQRQEGKTVGILDHLLRQFRLRSGQRAREVGKRTTTSREQLAFNLVGENVPAPAIPYGLASVPVTFSRRLDGIK